MAAGAYGNDGKGAYYRVMKSIDVSDESQLNKVMAVLGDAVLKGLAVKVELAPAPVIDTCVYFFIEELRIMPQCHFAQLS